MGKTVETVESHDLDSVVTNGPETESRSDGHHPGASLSTLQVRILISLESFYVK